MWKTLCYSVGPRSKEGNVPNQERTLTLNHDGVNVSVLCSGDIGSKVSNFGAEVIMNVSSEYIASNFDELHKMDSHDLKLKLFTYLHEILTNKAVALGVNFTDLATTLNLVAVKGNKYIVCFLGDGIIGWLKENKIKVICSSNTNEQSIKFLTTENAFGALKVESGILKGVSGFVLMSAGTANGFHLNRNNEFDGIVAEIVSTTGSITGGEMSGHMYQVFENFVIHKTDLSCSIVVMSTPKCASRYYALSDEEKMVLLKLSVHDSNAIGKVRDIDNILNLIGNGKTISDLAAILNIKEEFVKKKLRPLVFNNIISLNSQNMYKKIN